MKKSIGLLLLALLSTSVSLTSWANNFDKIKATSFTQSDGIKSEKGKQAEGNIGYIKNGSFASYNVDFGRGVKEISLSIASATKGGDIELRKGGVNGTLLATIAVGRTGGWQNWETITAALDPAINAKLKGAQDITLVFKGKTKGYLFNVSWFQFN